MHVTYLSDSQLLRALAKVVGLPAVATTTAFTYLHRIRCSDHDCQLTGQELVTACIYLAGKVEEFHVSANQLLNTARILCHNSHQDLLQSLAPLPASLAATTPPNNHHHQQQQHTASHLSDSQHAAASGSSLQHPPEQQQQQQQTTSLIPAVGEEYYKAKEQLFVAEQVVLRLMNFQLGVEQPHKHLFNFCKLLNVSRAVAAAAVCLLNDVVAYTACCVKFGPAVVAAAVLKCIYQLISSSKDSSNVFHVNSSGKSPISEQRQKNTVHDASPTGDVAAGQQQQVQQLEEAVHELDKGVTGDYSKHHQQGKRRDRFDKMQHHLAQQDENMQRPNLNSGSSSSSSSMQRALDGSWVKLIGLSDAEQQQVEDLQERLLQLVTEHGG